MKSPYRINASDRFLEKTFLKLFPRKVTPNQITIFRFFCVPLIALLILYGRYVEGTILFMAAVFSDALDGALARTKNMITEWGIAYDPLADKILIATTAILILPKYLQPWLVFAIIGLEMILIGTGYYYRSRRGETVVMANWWGKSKMICQSLGVFLVLLYVFWPITWLLIIAVWLLYLSLVLAIISIVTYSL